MKRSHLKHTKGNSRQNIIVLRSYLSSPKPIKRTKENPQSVNLRSGGGVSSEGSSECLWIMKTVLFVAGVVQWARWKGEYNCRVVTSHFHFKQPSLLFLPSHARCVRVCACACECVCVLLRKVTSGRELQYRSTHPINAASVSCIDQIVYKHLYIYLKREQLFWLVKEIRNKKSGSCYYLGYYLGHCCVSTSVFFDVNNTYLTYIFCRDNAVHYTWTGSLVCSLTAGIRISVLYWHHRSKCQCTTEVWIIRHRCVLTDCCCGVVFPLIEVSFCSSTHLVYTCSFISSTPLFPFCPSLLPASPLLFSSSLLYFCLPLFSTFHRIDLCVCAHSKVRL